MEKGQSRSAEYRKRLKRTNPALYDDYLIKQREQSKANRIKMKKDLEKRDVSEEVKKKKDRQLMLQRERQRRYIAQKTQERADIPLQKSKVTSKNIVTTRNLIKTKKDYNREMKRKSRANLSTQKKAWIRKKDRERKSVKRLSLKKVASPQVEVDSSGFSSKKTCWNVTSNARATLPSTPKKFAIVIDNLIKRTTPRKRKALEDIGVTPSKRLRGVSLDDSVVTKLNSSKTGKSALKTIAKTLVKLSIRVLANRLHLNRRTLSKRKCVVRRYKVDRKSIQQFYMREDISRVLPQRRYATKEGPGYALQVSIQAANSKYNAEYPSKRVSLGTFAAMRPKNVRKIAASHREFCCCGYCINVRFKLLSLNRIVLDKCKKKMNEEDIFEILLCPKPDNERFYKPECINGTCTKCSDNYMDTINRFYSDVSEDKDIYWSRWEKKKSKDGREKKVLVTKNGQKHDLLHELVHFDVEKPAQGTTFFQHFHIASWQTKQFCNIKNNLPNDCVLQVLDFAKNREVKYQDEIKSAYFTAQQITIHPIVTYYRGENGIVRETSIIISEDNSHDYHAVNHFQQIVDQHLATQLGQTPRKKIVFSDGCSSQYKSKGPFADLAHADIEINRNYFGSEHGKGDCDGETGVFNRAVDRAIIGKKVVINDAQDLFTYAKSNLELDETFTKRKFFFVENGDISRDRLETEVKTLVNTRKIHQALNTKTKNVLKVRNLSCFCNNCEDGDDANCLNTAYVHNYITKDIIQVVTPENLLKQHGEQGDQCSNVTHVDDWQPEGREKRKGSMVEKESSKSKKESSNVKKESSKVKKECSKVKNKSPNIKKASRKVKKASKAHVTVGKAHVTVKDQIEHNKTVDDPESINEDKLILECPKFSDLTKAVTKLHIEELPKVSAKTFCNTGCVVDNDSLPLVPEDIPLKPDSRLFPCTIYGDGNCLPRSASLLVYGSEENHKQMRKRMVIELTRNEAYYLDKTFMKKGKQDNAQDDVPKAFAQLSNLYMGQHLTTSVVKSLYEKEVFEIRKSGAYMGLWQIACLANILRCPVVSVCPTYGTHTVRRNMHRVFYPFNEELHECQPVFIMWTSLGGVHTEEKDFSLNHFDVLMPMTITENVDADLSDCMIDDSFELSDIANSSILNT